MPLSSDRDAEVPRYVGLRPRQRFTVTDPDGRHELDPARDRVVVDHPWVLQRPELWEPVDRMPGQERKHFERALARTRAELSAICGWAAARLERTGTRTVDPGAQDRGSGGSGGLKLRAPRRRALRLP
jgi:hypothetical protein